ncbi:hypothetical protein [Solibacillus sp. CAU 1738]|uniref:hypothetical protein n=1 Tax=Solibacillus sp. CAU 1738 TaxID=3140363 RepID=UPI0032601614
MFKKMIPFIAAMVILTACSDNEVTKTNSEVADTNQETVTSNEKVDQQQNKEQKENDEQQSNEVIENSEWTALPEYNKIVEQIDNQEYTFETVTDNEGKRVLNIIDKNGKKQYKSIFIKNTSRLKIIKIDGGGQIFNETLS